MLEPLCRVQDFFHRQRAQSTFPAFVESTSEWLLRVPTASAAANMSRSMCDVVAK
jgi:hypothetical protein